METPRTIPAPLDGLRVVVTRPRSVDEDDTFETRLRAWGAQVDFVPLVEIRLLPATLPPGSGYDWVFFTSRNAVRSAWPWLSRQAGLGQLPVAAVGPVTAQALRDFGKEAAFVSSVHDAVGAAAAFLAARPGERLRILWPCGNLAPDILPARLTQAGHTVTPLVVYETEPRRILADEERARFEKADVLVFTSPSAIQALAGLMDARRIAAHIASLGPSTSQAAMEAFGRVSVQADPYTLTGLADAMAAFFAGRGK